MKLCDYGCGNKAKYPFKNGKWCCSSHYTRCPNIRESMKERPVSDIVRKRSSEVHKGKIVSKETKRKLSKSLKGRKVSDETKKKISEGLKGREVSDETKKKIRRSNLGKKRSKETRIKNKLAAIGNKNRKGKKHRKETKRYLSLSNKKGISYYKKRYPFFSNIEEMRYNPDKLGEKEIQVHCKNNNCPNSKEKGGWFTPTYIQLYSRIIALEKPKGMIESNFYCSDECKNECPLYGVKSDPFKNIDKPYSNEEYNTFREFVLDRDDHCCVYCGNKAEHIHHERPQKLEPFFALDPDLAWAVCIECHYKYGHKIGTECSTGNLANTTCKGNV